MSRGILEMTPATAAEIIAIGIAGEACKGMMYRSTNTEEVWFGGEAGQLIGPVSSRSVPKFYGDYPNDATALADGVPLFGIYFLTRNNSYGGIHGMPKKLTEQ